jgi:hypothetical protein
MTQPAVPQPFPVSNGERQVTSKWEAMLLAHEEKPSRDKALELSRRALTLGLPEDIAIIVKERSDSILQEGKIQVQKLEDRIDEINRLGSEEESDIQY